MPITGVTTENVRSRQFLGEYAVLLARTAPLTADRLAKEEAQAQAVELLACIIKHPASWQIDKDNAARVMAELENELPPDIIAAALEREQNQSLEVVVAKILAEERQS